MVDLDNETHHTGTRARLSAVALAVACAIAASPSFARELNPQTPATASTVRTSEAAPLPVDLDPLQGFYPSVTVSATNDSNVFKTPDNEKEDWSVVVSPAVAWHGKMNGRHDVYAQYRADYTAYNDYSDLDTLNQIAQAGANLDMTEKLGVNGRIGYADGYERPGDPGARAVGFDPNFEPDHFTELFYEGQLVYGRRTNTLQVAGLYSHAETRFKNNDQEFRDRDSDAYGLQVYWNVSAATSFFVEGIWDQIDYVKPAGINYDSDVTTYNVGVTWEATTSTTGIIRVGNTEKDYDDPTLADFNGLTYEGRIRWQPVDYSTVEVYAAKQVNETITIDSSYIESTLYGISWNHSLTDRLGFNAYAHWVNDDFNDGRTDDYTSYGVSAVYDVTRWLDVGAGWGRTERNSDDPLYNYTDDIVSLFLTAHR